MSTYVVNTSANETLTANTADTVTVNSTAKGKVRIVNETGTSPIFINTGTISASYSQGAHGVEVLQSTITQPAAPTVGGQNEYEIPAEPGAFIELECSPSGAILSLISAGAMTYSVTSADEEDEIIP